MTDIVVEKLTDRDALLQAWRALFARADTPSIFLSPAWMEAWLQGAPEGGVLWVVKGAAGAAGAAHGETALLGVAGVAPARRPALIGPRAAHLHEFGDPARDAIYVEYNDFLAARDAPTGLREKALAALIDAIAPADELVLRNCRAPLALAAHAVAADKNLPVRVLGAQPTFVIDLERIRAGGDDYLDTRSASLRAQVKRTVRLYDQRGSIAFKRAVTPDERAEAWRALIGLHEESWRRRGMKGAFENAAFKAFHERLSALAPTSIDLWRLYAGDEVIACLYNLIDDNRVCNYQGGFKFEENNQLKPGMLAHALAAQRYKDEGYGAYDLLAGEAPYKRRLADEGETVTSLALDLTRGLRARLRGGLRRLRQALPQRKETRRT